MIATVIHLLPRRARPVVNEQTPPGLVRRRLDAAREVLANVVELLLILVFILAIGLGFTSRYAWTQRDTAHHQQGQINQQDAQLSNQQRQINDLRTQLTQQRRSQ